MDITPKLEYLMALESKLERIIEIKYRSVLK
jgi:hypothetical protein